MPSAAAPNTVTPPQETVDVAVVGLGAFGTSIAWRLKARGASVVGIERHTVPNTLGSSHGESRILRVVTQNHTGLYPLAQLSRRLWIELQEAGSELLFQPTGGLAVGRAGLGRIAQTDAVAAAFGLAPRRLSAAELRAEFPIFASVPDDAVAIWDAGAGALFPENCVQAAATAARDLGAVLLENTEVVGHSFAADGTVRVETSAGVVAARKVVYATGSWLAGRFPQLQLTPLRIPQTWFTSAGGPAPTVSELPPFPYDLPDDDQGLWGLGAVDAGGPAKVGTHGHPYRDRTVDVDNIDREVHQEDLDYLEEMMRRGFPTLDPVPARAIVCLLCESPDEQFTLGPIDDERVLVAGGESGQGFKHATGIGELVADMCLGVDSAIDRDFMRADRVL